MSSPINADVRPAERRALFAAAAVSVATSVHHVYGAVVYHTPWRYHAVAVSAGAFALILVALRLSRAAPATAASRAAWWTFWWVNTAVFALLLGAFEGVYNHVLKDLLYFGGAPLSVMRTLFPAPMYELPNNWLFELTGVLQVVPAAMAAIQLATLFSDRPGRGAAIRSVAAKAGAGRLAKSAQWAVRVTGPLQMILGIALWVGRAGSLRPAHMLIGIVFDLGLLTLVVLAARRGLSSTSVLWGIVVGLVIPLFGVVQMRILLGPAHWIVRSAHLLQGLAAMALARRLARFVTSAPVGPMRENVGRASRPRRVDFGVSRST